MIESLVSPKDGALLALWMTAQNGGDVMPSKDKRDSLLHGAMDKYDEMEPDLPPPIITPPSITKMNMSNPSFIIKNTKETQPCSSDNYDGSSALWFDWKPLEQNPDIEVHTRKKKVPATRVKYRTRYNPPEIHAYLDSVQDRWP